MEGRPCGPDTPAAARVWNYWLGGLDYYQPDRELADRIAGICPGAPLMAADSRDFTARAVTWAAREGVTRFLDLGCGYPRPPGAGIHDIARAVNPAAAVAYADIDEDVAHYSSWVYGEERKLEGVTATCADLRDPAAVLAAPGVREVIDLTAPVCVTAGAALHFMPADQAAEVTAGYMARLPARSILVATAGRVDDAGRWELVRAEWEAATGTGLWNFTRGEFAALFGGLEIVMVPGPVAGPRGAAHVLGGAARKP